jgi:hypothetical protein
LDTGRRARNAAGRLASWVRAAHTLRRKALRGAVTGWHDAGRIGWTPVVALARAREP